jgi:hypothetical protein
MKLVSDRELLTVRMEIAVGICTKFPNLYSDIIKGKLPLDGSAEESAADVLGVLIYLEPVIGKVLKVYYK